MDGRQDAALVELSRFYRPALMAFFQRRLRNHAEAEDLTQEVLARLVSMPADQMDNANAYIFQIAANLLRDRGRREKVRADYRFGVLAVEDNGVEALDPGRVLAGREALGQVAAVLRDLPERTRTIFILYRVEAMKKRDIAQSYGISVSAVDKHLMRAMALMIERLGGRP
ncbi:RNA polymerase sigma factor [Caulobacter mirabilis]|uniref:RNA polymerase subunit sigma-24 n=1 Tax=Caulobacter mirabilis TaxID=69666 RepID=A0A2D2B1D8_9CAUL|nr:sigma-70 family RNA polymerase sigma factor [Caulobacter mirabilis]ATQ44059.1 RNA polymerase subunit sigma-24 [Caulobacter mirabilis]